MIKFNTIIKYFFFILLFVILFELIYFFLILNQKEKFYSIEKNLFNKKYTLIDKTPLSDEELKIILSNFLKFKKAKVFREGKVITKFSGIIKDIKLTSQNFLIIYLVKSYSSDDFKDDQYFVLNLNQTKIMQGRKEISYKNLKISDYIDLEINFDYNNFNQKNIIYKNIL